MYQKKTWFRELLKEIFGAFEPFYGIVAAEEGNLERERGNGMQ